MPVSQTNTELIHHALKSHNVRIVSALPETWLVGLIGRIEDDPDMTLVRLAKEEEGVGVSVGASLAGVRSALLMQNHGLFAAINGVVSVALLYRVPMLMLITHRGRFGERDPWQTEGGLFTEPILDALRIAHDTITDAAQVERKIADAVTLADASLRPVALLLDRDLMWENA